MIGLQKKREVWFLSPNTWCVPWKSSIEHNCYISIISGASKIDAIWFLYIESGCTTPNKRHSATELPNDAYSEGRAVLCVTQAVLEEYLRIIARLPIAPESKNKLVAILQEKRNMELVNPSRHYSVIREDPEDHKSLSVNNIPPFVKGGWGDFLKAGQSKSPYVPLFQRGI